MCTWGVLRPPISCRYRCTTDSLLASAWKFYQPTLRTRAEGKRYKLRRPEDSKRGPRPDYVAYVFACLGSIIICLLYKLTLSDRAQTTLRLTARAGHVYIVLSLFRISIQISCKHFLPVHPSCGAGGEANKIFIGAQTRCRWPGQPNTNKYNLYCTTLKQRCRHDVQTRALHDSRKVTSLVTVPSSVLLILYQTHLNN
jgi:hypothetical protein